MAGFAAAQQKQNYLYGPTVSSAADLTIDCLEVVDQLKPLLPRGIPRGIIVSVNSTSVLLALLAKPTQLGSWVGIVEFPTLGFVAASELGVDLTYCVLIPRLSSNSIVVIAALIDAFDIVVIGKSLQLKASDERRLLARARERKSVVLLTGKHSSEHPSLLLNVVKRDWKGISEGDGHFTNRQYTVKAFGKGLYTKEKQRQILFDSSKKAR